MSKFRIMPHGRLQEWVAEEKGYYEAEGLEYEFVRGTGRQAVSATEASVQSADSAPAPRDDGRLRVHGVRSCL